MNWILILTICVSAPGLESAVPTFEYNLDANITMLMDKYFPAMHKPFILENTIYTYAELYAIVDVNEVEETITTKLWLSTSYMIWNMAESTWDETLGSHVLEVNPPANKLWNPDIIILNSVELVQNAWDKPLVSRMCCVYDGTTCDLFCPMVSLPYALTVKTSCTFDVTDFPFDFQTCHIDIGPWTTSETAYPRQYFGDFGAFKMLHPQSLTEMTLEAFTPNSQWDVLRVKISDGNRTAYLGAYQRFSFIRYTIEMKRRPTFFVNTLVLPCVLLTVLDVFSVFLPVESGEKVGLGITIMLAQVVNLLILSTILPTSSVYFPFLGTYFFATIVVIGVSLVYNSCITNYFFNDYKSVFQKSKRIMKKLGKSGKNSVGSDQNLENKPEDASETASSGADNFDNEDRISHRRDVCAVCDTVCGIVMTITVLVIHAVYFWPFL